MVIAKTSNILDNTINVIIPGHLSLIQEVCSDQALKLI